VFGLALDLKVKQLGNKQTLEVKYFGQVYPFKGNNEKPTTHISLR